ncbi:hypothetical protein HBI55_026190 [Parastagonospora nodorum]|nr:hypothetical protein HBI84_067140 [Parastagonospora nodorum]KAH6503426.1 hypothetical protein HBI55_026190 [Parastagonospora nodorum]
MSAEMAKRGGPYLSTVWALGGTPKKNVDVPITAVFLALFVISAAWHMTIFQKNRGRGHKFIFNAALFGFSMSRIVTCILRIASICLPSDIQLAIAATIFVAAGVLIVFVVNIIWAQRVLRATHPKLGWHRVTKIIFIATYVLIAIALIITITSVIQNFYTLRPRTKFIDRALLLYGQTFLAIISSLPILIVGLALALPRRTPLEKFGAGKHSIKIAILLTGSTLLTLGAWYRCGTSWQTPVSKSQPLPAYFAKPCFYIFNFGVEIVTLYLYAITRVDLRFHVPNGAKGPGSYVVRNEKNLDEETGEEKEQGEVASIEPLRET